MSFVPDAVDANEGICPGFTATRSRGEPGDGIKPHGWRGITMMG